MKTTGKGASFRATMSSVWGQTLWLSYYCIFLLFLRILNCWSWKDPKDQFSLPPHLIDLLPAPLYLSLGFFFFFLRQPLKISIAQILTLISFSLAEFSGSMTLYTSLSNIKALCSHPSNPISNYWPYSSWKSYQHQKHNISQIELITFPLKPVPPFDFLFAKEKADTTTSKLFNVKQRSCRWWSFLPNVHSRVVMKMAPESVGMSSNPAPASYGAPQASCWISFNLGFLISKIGRLAGLSL